MCVIGCQVGVVDVCVCARVRVQVEVQALEFNGFGKQVQPGCMHAR